MGNKVNVGDRVEVTQGFSPFNGLKGEVFEVNYSYEPPIAVMLSLGDGLVGIRFIYEEDLTVIND